MDDVYEPIASSEKVALYESPCDTSMEKAALCGPSSDISSEEAVLCESSYYTERIELVRRYRAVRSYTVYLITATCLLSLACILLVIQLGRSPSDAVCTARIQGWSPMLESIEYEDINFDNDFLHQTRYRGPPTNYLEREWERLWNHDLIALPMSDFHYMNKSHETLWLEAPGGIAANLEVFHQIHCLNLIRQYTWRDYYDQHASLVEKPTDMTRADERGLRIHVDHCIETLRLTLMCHGDVTPYLHFRTSEEDKIGAADFNAKHKCRRFDKIVEAYSEKTVRERWTDPKFPSKQYELIPGLVE